MYRFLVRILLLFCAVFVHYSGFSQSSEFDVEIVYSDNNSKQSIKHLSKFEKWFLVINKEEVEFKYDKSKGFLFCCLSDDQISFLKTSNDVMFRAYNKKKCYVGLLPTFPIRESMQSDDASLNSNKMHLFFLYKVKKTLFIQYKHTSRTTEEQLTMIAEGKAKKKIVVFENQKIVNKRLIPCDEYRGEYDVAR